MGDVLLYVSVFGMAISAYLLGRHQGLAVGHYRERAALLEALDSVRSQVSGEFTLRLLQAFKERIGKNG